MKKYRIIFEISKWEFFRWFKLKDQIVTLLISCGIGLVVWGGIALLGRSEQDPVQVFVLNEDLLPLAIPEGSRLVLHPAVADSEQTLRQAVGQREIDGLLILRSIDTADLLVYKQPLWKDELEQYLTQARMQSRIRSMGISPNQFADAFKSFSVNIVFGENSRKPTSTAEKIAAGIVMGLMLVGVFISFAYQFVAITGEKQLRVTEQIISAVSPQQWVDGKILGVSGYAFASLITYVISILIFILFSGLFGAGLELPVEITHPFIVVILALLGLCGLLFWNTFFAALAATINDPNTSARGSMVFLPVVPTVIVGLLAMKNPDTVLIQVLSVFPVTAPAALAGRLVLTEVPAWEILSAIILLVISIWFMRTAAGKIFHLGVLMYGKEPSFKEILRWAREA
jgi:ABC-2 type transport system permease protein